MAKGKVRTEVVPKDTESLEGRQVAADVVETYVPLDELVTISWGLLKSTTTSLIEKISLDGLLSHSTAVLFTLTIGLLFAFIVILFKENKTTAERKHAEAALRESEEKLSGILNSIPDMILVLNNDLNITWANRIAIELLDSNPVGKKCLDAFNLYNEPCGACNVQKSFEDWIERISMNWNLQELTDPA